MPFRAAIISLFVASAILCGPLSCGAAEPLTDDDRAFLKEKVHVWWFAPFFSGGGYSSEALSLVQSIADSVATLKISHHGDSFNSNYVAGLSEQTAAFFNETSYSDLSQLFQKKKSSNKSRKHKLVVVCHSEPGAWNPPLYQTTLCPPKLPKSKIADIVHVGRTMFETDRIPDGWVSRCNGMDAIWVPTAFHRDTFLRSGVSEDVLDVLPESVDVDFYSRDNASPQFSLDDLGCAGVPSPKGGAEDCAGTEEGAGAASPFVFLSVFKFEERKAWDVLLEAYFTAFAKTDHDVKLVILTSKYHQESAILPGVIRHLKRESTVLQSLFALDDDAVAALSTEKLLALLPPLCFIDSHVPTTDMPALYASADAFVLPSRGEGWGRPQVEAMSVGLPVIITNYSGPTEYLTEENGYAVPLDEDAPFVHPRSGAFTSHLWANPSAKRLADLLVHVVQNKEEAQAKGKRAREDMVAQWSPPVVSEVLLRRLLDVKKKETK